MARTCPAAVPLDTDRVCVKRPRGTVTPIDTATNTPGPPIPIGRGPGLIVITPDGRTAYVAHTWENTGRLASGQSTVTPVATATNTAGVPIGVGGGASAIAITPGASHL